MYFTGLIIAVSTFLIIGLFHPLVIKTEYYWGTRPWNCLRYTSDAAENLTRIQRGIRRIVRKSS